MHRSPYRGRWYPAESRDLDRLLNRLFDDSAGRTGQFLYPGGRAFVVPHAGPEYSGTVAASVYRTLAAQRPERVVVIGFPHRGGLRGMAWPDCDAIETPLGPVGLDREFCSRLPFRALPEDRLCDHSVEIQLPFLQKAVPAARIAALYAGDLDEESRKSAAAALAQALTPGTVLLASSDFTHFGRDFGYLPFPPDDEAQERIRSLDHQYIEEASGIQASAFLAASREATVCGRDPIALLLEALRSAGADHLYQATLDYQTSAEITGEVRHSVSYAALGYFPAESFHLGAEDREALLESAEATLEQLRVTGARRAVPVRGGTAALQMRRGVFVSLHRGEQLLGCIGNCGERESLALMVPELTLSAALDDSRFAPATRSTGAIQVEISVLSPMRRIRHEEEFRVGTHGAALEYGAHRGLLLPQVAQRRGWTARDFLEMLGRKAGTRPQAWCDPDAKLSVFEAQVFSRAG